MGEEGGSCSWLRPFARGQLERVRQKKHRSLRARQKKHRSLGARQAKHRSLGARRRSTYPSGAKSEAHILRAYWHGDRDVGVGGRRGGVVRDGEDNAKEGFACTGPRRALENPPARRSIRRRKRTSRRAPSRSLTGKHVQSSKPGQTCWDGTSRFL